ncbi:MAG: GNAT family N-acetyltransferase [Saprospiraceae bacterium]|nr:GNAT family N-acetyltransferase [Saprospiraceae bacterium]
MKKHPSLTLVPTKAGDVDYVMALEHNNRRWICPWSAERHLAAIEDPDQRHYLLLDSEGKKQGLAILLGPDREHRSIMLKRLVVENKGQRWGSACMRLLLEICFEKYDLHRFWLEVFADNERARRLYVLQGLKEEVHMRKRLRKEGEFRDVIIMAMLSGEYRQNQAVV